MFESIHCSINIYSHFIPSLESEAANTFDKLSDKVEEMFTRAHEEVSELIDLIAEDD